MTRFSSHVWGVIVALVLVTPSQAQDDKTDFAPTDQVNLMLTQAKRAFVTYAASLKDEQLLVGSAEMLVADRQVLADAQKLLDFLEKKPELFNSPVGFQLVIDLDDASRNAAICMGQAGIESSTAQRDGHVDSALAKLNVAQSCMSASALLHTVSESASALYEKYVLASDKLLRDAVQTAETCDRTMRELKRRSH